jgi:DNA replication and repair protein RecF
MDQWKSSRNLDRDQHMTHIGIHRSDFAVIHGQKGEGSLCSTGEQKILLMGLILSFLTDRLLWSDRLIVMLFDECVSHFDFRHRMVLFEQIRKLHADHKGSFHPFMTGTDKNLFAPFGTDASYYHVEPSCVSQTYHT